MLESLTFNHIGIATKNVNKAVKRYETLGYKKKTNIIDVPTQSVKVCFLYKEGHPLLELIEPLGDKSPINNILAKMGAGPYHLCYSTNNLSLTIEELKRNKFMPIGKPLESSAFDNNLVCFAYNADIGIIEIVEILNRNA